MGTSFHTNPRQLQSSTTTTATNTTAAVHPKKMSTGKNTKRKNQYSICENSTIIAANLVRASSFVLADMALGSLSAGAAPVAASDPVLQRDRTMMHMRRVEKGSHSTPYVMEPDDGNRVDTQAEEYILKVRQKNRSDAATAADISNSCIPPPPSKKSWATYPR